MEPLRPGDPAQIGSYQLVCRLGDTGLGQAYGGRGPGGGPLVTVTVLHGRLAQDPEFRDRFRLDVNNARRVTGPYLVPVDADTESASPWLAAGSPDAPSLDAVVADSGPLPPHLIRELAVALTAATTSAHEAGARLVGIEPSNVMMAAEGPRVSHVGITHMAQSAAAGGATEADAVHGIGTILHFAATGRPPAPARWQAVPPPIADPVLGPLIAGCLAAQPAARPTLRDLAARLGGAAAQGATMPAAMYGAPGPAAMYSAPGPGGPPPMPPPPPGGMPPPPPGGMPPMAAAPRQPWWRAVPASVIAAAVVLAAVAALAFSAGGDTDTFGAPPAAGATTLPEGLPTLPGDLPTDSTDPDDDGDQSDPSIPTASATPDPIGSAETGDCFDNAGTDKTADLSPAACGPGNFKVVQVLHGTTVTSGCDHVAGDDWNVSYTEHDLVLCLSYQYEHGTAYHAKAGTCVYGDSAASDWDELDCQTGAFTVLARYTGTTDGNRCKGLRNEDWAEHFGVSGRDDLGVVLCLSMIYPDDAGHATLHECMRFTGSSTRPSLHSVSCNAANVVITGRTPTYNNSKFCGTDAWATWKPNNYASLSYTVCYRYR
ncbi:hypothetical protein [Streptomyces sp. NPDC049040]|uniref:LppU/SCO3897 family protein n=1 Tax=Streptomyces sp. NPDC049040 TaxID=3365593 RepID=UPI00371668D2